MITQEEGEALLKAARAYIGKRRQRKYYDKFDVAVALNDLEDLIVKIESRKR